jgi:hypothetical protein
MGYRRTRKHKSRKSKSRKYRRQRGGDEQPVTSTETNITGTIDEYLNEANELIGTVKKETETTVSDLFNSIGSVFSSNNSQSTTPQATTPQPTTPQTAGRKRRRRKHKKTHRK